MATVARADIEALLRARKLDTTLTPTRPDLRTLEPSACPAACLAEAAPQQRREAASQRRRDDQFVVATGIALLDQRLGGGLARGQLSEIVGSRSSGRTSVVVSAMTGAASRGELVALVDTFDTFDPPSARACGLDLSRLLWVRGRVDRPESFDNAPSLKLDCALKAANLILQAGGFGLVVLDLADASPSDIRRLPFTTWFRLQRPIEGSSTACVLLASEPTARSAGGVSVALRRVAQAESKSWASYFVGFDVEADIRRARGIAETCHFSCAATL